MEQHTKQAVQHLELLEISLKNQIELCTQHLAQVETAKRLILCSAQLPLVIDEPVKLNDYAKAVNHFREVAGIIPASPLVVTVSGIPPERIEEFKAQPNNGLEDCKHAIVLPVGSEVNFVKNKLPLSIEKGQIKLEGDSINSETPRCRGAKGLAGVHYCINKSCIYDKVVCMETITLVAYEAGLLTFTFTCPACESNPCLCP